MTVAQSKNNVTVTTKSEGITNLFDGTFPIADKQRIEKQGAVYRYIRVFREGTTLIFERIDKDSKKDIAKTLSAVRESWVLSPDGKVLTRFRQTIEAAQNPGEKPKITDQKYVFDKQ
jgi:hypothetical protein